MGCGYVNPVDSENSKNRMIFRRFAAPSYRYILNLEIMDHTGSAYVSMFNDDAETLLGMRAEQLNELLLSNKDESDNVFKRALFKEYVFTLRVKVVMNGLYEL